MTSIPRGRVPIAALFILSLNLAFSSPRAAIPKWAEEVTAKWYAALHAGDASSFMKLYAADAVAVLPTQTLRGRSAIEAFHRRDKDRTGYKCTWTIGGAHALAKQAAVWGTDNCIETPKGGGPSRTAMSEWLTVYERQPDNSWLIVRDSYDEKR